jgi:transcriptional regulator with XRE-family HTH domain
MIAKRIPKRLGEKLKLIREYKGWTLEQMADVVGKTGQSRRTRVYEWENGIRQPDLLVLLEYARMIEISTDDLIDDEIDLCFETGDPR